MKYNNPVVPGFYPDPSVCEANGKYYMVNSSFQYFPGVPLFESEDLVNWKQIGNVLTRKSQVYLEKINSSGGVFAPTIRYNNGRFYMVTTNDTTHQNFYVYTDDIYGEWSEPIFVDQSGIDPSLLFDDGKVYFMSNGSDDFGDGGVVMCQIDIETGKKLTPSKSIWHGNGGRFLESPHLYHIGNYYYLMAAEGGTEYGHMIVYARADEPWGPFENYCNNPVLTNRNKAPYIIQGIGHGDLIERNGKWFIICLGFRQIGQWRAYHTLGREVFLVPVTFKDGWFTAGKDGTADDQYEIEGEFKQEGIGTQTFSSSKKEWAYLRHPDLSNYELKDDLYTLHGTLTSLDQVASPTFIGLRQRGFDFELKTVVEIDKDIAGVTVFSCENEHYDLYISKENDQYSVQLKYNVGPAKVVVAKREIATNKAELIVKGSSMNYSFYLKANGQEVFLGSADSKYVSTEVSEGFTGVMLGLYSVGDNNTAKFSGFEVEYIEK